MRLPDVGDMNVISVEAPPISKAPKLFVATSWRNIKNTVGASRFKQETASTGLHFRQLSRSKTPACKFDHAIQIGM